MKIDHLSLAQSEEENTTKPPVTLRIVRENEGMNSRSKATETDQTEKIASLRETLKNSPKSSVSPKAEGDSDLDAKLASRSKYQSANRKFVPSTHKLVPGKNIDYLGDGVLISLNTKEITRMLQACGLNEKEIADLSFTFKHLRQSNRITRKLFSWLPIGNRIREFVSRIESNSRNKINFFVNNFSALYNETDGLLLNQETAHHLFHFVQQKKMERHGLLGRAYFRIRKWITHLPIIHALAPNEKEARDFAEKAKNQYNLLNFKRSAPPIDGKLAKLKINPGRLSVLDSSQSKKLAA
ncbi:MAG: hypothetical protein WC269_02625 [Candidatus Gracilibacteria bacterium]|jgi:hypothetical protein